MARRRSIPGARRGNRLMLSRRSRGSIANRSQTAVQVRFSGWRLGSSMLRALYLIVTAITVLAFNPARSEDAASPAPAPVAHVCLDQKERRAEYDAGKIVRLSVAMRAARSRM